MIANVYRPERNWSGDLIGEMNDYYIGDIDGVVIGGPTPQPIPGWAGVVSTEGLIGVRRQQDSGITVAQHDRLKIGDIWFAITGPAQWTFSSELTGTDFGYSWFQAEAVYG